MLSYKFNIGPTKAILAKPKRDLTPTLQERRKERKFDAREDRILTKMAKADASSTEIAAILSRTRGSVIGRAKRIGVRLTQKAGRRR